LSLPRLVYGLRPVEELLRSQKPVSALYYAEGRPAPALERILKTAQAAQVSVAARPRAELDALAGGALHQGVVAVAGDFPYREPLDVVAAARATGAAPLLLVLDEVQDPQNLGALVRSAHILGAHGLIVPRHRAATVTPAVVKAAAGATEHTPIALCTNVARTLEELKEEGLWIVGASAHEGEPPWAIDFTLPTVLVLGSEGKGLRPLVERGCDRRVYIPVLGRVASLNVSAAGAILLYEALRQRSHRPE
jgi:23S rRNA (guanosine2251-2'-O)-methyltransferase